MHHRRSLYASRAAVYVHRTRRLYASQATASRRPYASYSATRRQYTSDPPICIVYYASCVCIIRYLTYPACACMMALLMSWAHDRCIMYLRVQPSSANSFPQGCGKTLMICDISYCNIIINICCDSYQTGQLDRLKKSRPSFPQHPVEKPLNCGKRVFHSIVCDG